MSSIDNNLGGGGGSASASGKKGAIQLSDGNFNLTSNKELKSDPKTGTITTTGLTTTGTIWASTISTSNLVAETVEDLTVVGNAYVTGDATVDGTISTTKVDISGTLTSAWVTVSGTLTATSITGTSANIAGEIKAGTLSSTGDIVATGSLSGASLSITGDATVDSNLQVGHTITVGEDVVVTIKDISAGDNHTALVDTDGVLWGTGDTAYLGVGSQTTYTSFTQIPTTKSVANVACGASHTMIIDVDGTVSGTGLNNAGQLGDGTHLGTILTFTSNTTPVTASQIACGGSHTMIIDTNGIVFGVGAGQYGQLGNEGTGNYVFTSNATPVTASQISCGTNHTMILGTNGTVSGTGHNNEGQLGLGTSGGQTYTFRSTGVTASQIVCGPNRSFVIYANGNLAGTGFNNLGVLGLGYFGNKNTFTSAVPPVTASKVAAGISHTIIIDNNGTVSGVGLNTSGQLGIPSVSVYTLTFTPSTGPVTASQIACGDYTTMIVGTNGTVSGTGANTSGQLGIGSLANSTSFTDTNISPYYSSQATEIYSSNNELNLGFTNKYMTIDQSGNVNVEGSLGVGTTDTAEYKFLVNDGTSNLFGVPLSASGLATGKTIVYDGSGWVYDNAGPADGTQTGEILTWNGSEWSANSAVVVEGTSVGIGSAQPTQKLDVIGNVKATDFIGSGEALSDLNASNVTSGTLSNNRLPQTISVSNLEATANLVVGGPADITGTLSAAGITSSEDITVTGNNTLSASNLRTSNLFVTGPADITGTLSASSIIGSGAGISTLNASNITSGTLSNNRLPNTISVSNLEATANLVVGGPADITGTLSASSIIGSGAGISTLNASNITSGTLSNNRLPQTISVSNLEATANLVVGGPADITGTLSAAGITSSEDIIVTGNNTLSASNIKTSNLTVTNSHNVLGNLFVSHTVSAPTLLVSKDAQVTGNLTVSGGVVTITTTTTGTSNIVITNAGTGPVLVATQLGAQPIANFIDGRTGSNVSALFISGGEQGSGRDGYVGLGTTEPAHHLDVRGDANVATNLFVHGTLSTSNIEITNIDTVTDNAFIGGTLSASNVETSNLTVTNRLSGGTISVSNIETSNLTITNLNSVTNDAFIGGTLSASNIQSSNLTVTNLNSVTNDAFIGGTLSASNIQSSNLTVTNLNSVTNDAFIGGTLSASNIQSSNLTVTNLNSVTNDALIGGTLSASNIQSSNLTVTNLNSVTNDAFIGGTLSASNIQSSNLTVTNLNSVTNDAFIGGTLSASNIQSSNLTVTNLNSVTNDAFIGGTLSASNVETSNLTVNGNAYVSSNLGVGTADTAEYKFLVKNGTSNLFGVPYDTANLTDGKTIVYNGSDWVYDNAGPADGTQSGEILTWNGSEWSANSAVVVEGSNVGIGSTQPREILDVAGNVRITQSVLINETFQGRAMRLNDTPASNLHYQPNFTITGSLTSAGDIKTNQSFRGHNMFLSNVLTISGGVVTNTGTVNTTINGSLTVQGDAVVNSNISAVSVNTGDVISNRAVHGKAIRLGNTPESNVYYNPNLTVSGSITAGGDVKSGTTFRGPDMVLSGTASVGTLSTSNITHGSELTITSNLLMGPGTTLTASNIVGASPVTISSGLVMGSGSTLTTSNIVGSSFLTVTANTNVVAEFTASEKLIKYPRVKMTAATTSNYTASASSELSSVWAGWKAFNGVVGDEGWHDAGNKYKTSDGSYDGGNSLGGYSGEWIKLQLPDSIKLTQIRIAPRILHFARAPKDAVCLGSTDGSNWYLLTSWSNASYTNGSFTNFYVNTNNYYSYIAIVTTQIDSLDGTLNISEIEYYGYPENDLGDGTSVLFKTVPNIPKTDFLDVYYDASNTNSSSTVVKNIVDDSSATPVDLTFTSTDPKAWYFDGSTSNVTGTHGLGTGNVPHSHAVWFKRTSAINTWDYVCSIGTFTNDQQSAIAINSNQINWSIYATNIRASPIIENDTWYHVVISYNGQNSTTEIYINGLIQNVTVEGAGTLNLTGTTLKLGCRPGDGDYFNGSIANYRLYDRPLSADEVWELYGYQKAYFSVSPDVVTYKAGRVGIGTSEPRAVLDVVGDVNVSGQIVSTTASILYLLDEPLAHEWEYSNELPAAAVKISYGGSLPTNTKAVLADVFLGRDDKSGGDHQNHVLGRNHSLATTWTSNKVQPSTIFGNNLKRQTVLLTMPGETDGFTHYFGKWCSSQVIPIEGNNMYYSNKGNTSSSGWVYVITRGYYL
jgi:alpha-tubulin suppressor-like RCC1 family protein